MWLPSQFEIGNVDEDEKLEKILSLSLSVQVSGQNIYTLREDEVQEFDSWDRLYKSQTNLDVCSLSDWRVFSAVSSQKRGTL